MKFATIAATTIALTLASAGRARRRQGLPEGRFCRRRRRPLRRPSRRPGRARGLRRWPPSRQRKGQTERPPPPKASAGARSQGRTDLAGLPSHALLLSARSDFGSSGQRGRAGASSPSISPSRSRSIPAQAIIAPLSVQSFGGGATNGRPASAQKRVSASRIARVGARRRRRQPPRGAPRRSAGETVSGRAHAILDHVDHRRLERRAEIGDIARAHWRDAHSATPWRTAVFSPDSEKSAFGRPISGRGNAKRAGSPFLRRRLDRRPAGKGQPEQACAVLSNASPIASSMVAPSRS